MKVTFKQVALFMVFSMAMAGCQKETMVEPDGIIREVQIVRTVNYSVDSVPMQTTLYGESEWTEFVTRMV